MGLCCFASSSGFSPVAVLLHPVASLFFRLARDTSNADGGIHQIINSTPSAPETCIPVHTHSTTHRFIFVCLATANDAGCCSEGRSNRSSFPRQCLLPCSQFATATTLNYRMFQFDGCTFQASNHIHPRRVLKKLSKVGFQATSRPATMVRALNGPVAVDLPL